MARPQKNSTQKRSATLRVRVTADEKNAILDAARDSGLTASDYLRGKALNIPPRLRMATPERAAFIKALAELGKIGSNLNQIARALNQRQAGTVNLTHLASLAETGITQLSANLHKILEHGH